jgi:hypothetical protein
MTEKVFRKKTREESQTKISDEIISPYFIYFDGISYTLVKEKNNGNEENIGYYTNLSGALKATAKNLVNDQKTVTISDFLLRYDTIINKITEKFDI